MRSDSHYLVDARTVSPLCFVLRFPSSFLTRAVIFSYDLSAFVTLHRAAPLKFAVAAAHNLDALLHHPEAAVVAQPAAALPLPVRRVLVSLQTLPAFCALYSQAVVLEAVIRRILQINELRRRDALKGLDNGSSVVRAVSGPHGLLVHLQLLCLLVLHLKVVAHFSEVGQLHPACLDVAAARHPVTLACLPHGGFDRLVERERASALARKKHVLTRCFRTDVEINRMGFRNNR